MCLFQEAILHGPPQTSLGVSDVPFPFTACVFGGRASTTPSSKQREVLFPHLFGTLPLFGQAGGVLTPRLVTYRPIAPPDHVRLIDCHSMEPLVESQLSSPPDDGVSSVKFAPNLDRLAVSSWDKVSSLCGYM